ncbi:MFS transporter [Propionicicella superfundia]|uniref:MFS transporter n=1 Tax=Propionicicella superfundia TaxID=348582 RepID=UPI00041D20AF|nr:MFS transporter [Propionicicella superfundia]
MADPELRALLRRLVLPVYVPAALYATGAAAIVPVIPLVGLRLGLSVPQVALLTTIAGLVTVIGPIPTGQLVVRIGERAALIIGGAVSVGSVIACLVAAGTSDARPGAMAALFCVAILVMSLGDLTWDLGRQTYVADEVPARFRARAMTLFGGTIRVGRIVGPLLGAGAIALGGLAAPFAVHLVAAVASIVLITVFLVPGPAAEDPASLDDGGAPPLSRRDVVRPLILVGIAPLVLTAVRTNRDLLLPLLGNHFGHSESVVALVFGVAALVELAFIWPAGPIMDRFGRAAVLVPCLVITGISYLLAPLAGTVAGFLLLSVVFAVGNGLGAGIVKTLSADVTPPERRAAWMGLYNSLVGTGSLVGPALVTVATGIAGIVTASFLTGGLALAGAVWAAHWVPRLIPRPRLRESQGPPVGHL